MPLPPARRLAALTLACLLASGGAAALAPSASALSSAVVRTLDTPGATAEDVSTLDVTDRLTSGSTLYADQQITSSDGGSRFVMQGDGNAVVYDASGRPTFSTETAGVGSRIEMQSDGNLVVYTASGRPVWQSGTAGSYGASLVMQNDGNLVVYRTDGSAAWSSFGQAAPPAVSGDTLTGGSALRSGQQLTSRDSRSRAVMQGDGNFVVYSNGSVRWSSGTSGAGNRLEMQGDGNAVVYSGSRSLWQSSTAGNPGARMVMQDDGNLVIYSGSRPVWSSTAPPAPPAPTPPPSGNGQSQLNGGTTLYGNESLLAGEFRAPMQSDGNFAVYGAGPRLRWAAGVSGQGNRLVMQTDGNAVIYSAGGSARWQSGTSGNPGARMVMQTDGNLVIYSAGGRALWQTNTIRLSFPGDTRNCPDFATQRDAQAEFNRYYLDYGDVFMLDEDNDRIACESNRP
ncbi:hypothetical protein HQQ82_17430 [Rathayibacter sp. VKM Ac-2856]|uniref:hypothetical protein n=1 Tax=unclassified Rathayibacter TaxID=2609250 RepID=UPI0015676205|nr:MULTISPECIES: hypothetical protein [unclassified Rathayibacter]NQX06587.1 hypothetical protein [Rathayibacter sp. VKM Ac-2858]NQX21754.1 hypothetical protein [Rathayibacter sp. VKM Ac-2856]